MDEINETKSKMADIPICSKKNEANIDQSKGVEITAVKPPKILEDKFILNIIRESKNKF